MLNEISLYCGRRTKRAWPLNSKSAKSFLLGQMPRSDVYAILIPHSVAVEHQ